MTDRQVDPSRTTPTSPGSRPAGVSCSRAVLASSRFDPFRRSDTFGEIGEGPLSRSRTAALWIRTALIVPPRAIGCLALSLTMRVVCLVTSILPFTRRWLIAPAAMLVSRSLLFLLGFIFIRHKRFTMDPDRPEPPKIITNRHAVPLVVSNHVSWLDILVVQYLYSAAYVTRVETRKTPIVGAVCDALPCIYVDRDKQTTPDSSQGVKSTTDKVVERARLKWNNPKAPFRPLAIFPEGTTTNGKFLLPFRTGAFVAGIPIFELPMYFPSEQEQSDPRLYADNVRQYMVLALRSVCFIMILFMILFKIKWGTKLGLDLKDSDSGFEDKKEFHKLLREKLGIES